MSVRFTWNPVKAEGNKRKHKIEFEEATQAFFDPFALFEEDRVEDGEYRSSTIGEAYGVILFVAYTYDYEEHETELIRIISARYAVRAERKRYEEARYGYLRS